MASAAPFTDLRHSQVPSLIEVESLVASNALGNHHATARRVNSQALLGGARSIEIEHEGERYVLRATRLGKLILTK